MAINRTTKAGHRLIHDDVQVIALIEATSGVVTETRHKIYTGTLDACRAEIARLGLSENIDGEVVS